MCTKLKENVCAVLFMNYNMNNVDTVEVVMTYLILTQPVNKYLV